MIRYNSVYYYNTNRSQPVTVRCINTWDGAPVDRRRLTGDDLPQPYSDLGSDYSSFLLCINRLPDSWNNRIATVTGNLRLQCLFQEFMCNCPCWERPRHLLEFQCCQTTVFIIEVIPALSDGAFPHRAPLDWATPELAQAEMATHHM